MDHQLNPYDTGERLEPHPWVRGDVATPRGLPRRVMVDDYGRVDFDDDEGATVFTVYAEPTPEGYMLHVEPLTSSVTVRVAADDVSERKAN